MAERFAVPILHVDMDAFFVEVERRSRPELMGRPVVVAGSGPRAVVAAASYEARAFGVGSAMPMAEARRRCPAAIVVPPNHRSYRAMSRRVFQIFEEFTPQVEGLSVDEAFLDVAGLRLHYDDAAEVGRALRKALRERLELPASVGGAVTKFLAKLASEEAKPDGLKIVAPGSELEFLHPMPVRRLWGVGEATLAGLEELGIVTVGDLAGTPVTTLQARLGRSLGSHLSNLAHARDDRAVEPGGGAKSISVEETYDEDLRGHEARADALFELCHRLAGRLDVARVGARTLTLKVRLDDFTTLTRSTTPRAPVTGVNEIWDLALALLAKAGHDARGVRLLGVGGSGLVALGDPQQLTIGGRGRDEVARVARRVKERYGDDAVKPARLARRPNSGRGEPSGT